MAEIGTVMELRYVALDLTHPSQVEKTIATRTITIADPCPGEYFCEDDRTCSPVDCASRMQLGLSSATEEGRPVVRLNGGALLRVPYGQPLSMSLGFCSSLNETDCGAYAAQMVNGELVVPNDLVITSSCMPADAREGRCLPGAYVMRYKAFGRDGSGSNVATRVLVVEQRGTVSFDVTLPIADLQAAEDAAEAFKSNGFQNNLTQYYIDAFIETFGGANTAISEHTVSIADVSVSEAGNQASVVLHFRVRVSSAALESPSDGGNNSSIQPEGLAANRRSLLSIGQGRRRRLLSSETLSAKISSVLSSLNDADARAVFSSDVGNSSETSVDGLLGGPLLDEAPSESITTPDVDVIGGMITTLAASLESYAEEQTSLNFEISKLLVDTNKVSGEGGTQFEAALETETKEHLKGLLAEQDEVTSSQLRDLTDVMALFDQALAAQLSLNSSLSATIAGIEENLASQARFLNSLSRTQEFLEDIIGPNWDGAGTPPPCARSQNLGNAVFEFAVSSVSMDSYPASESAPGAEAAQSTDPLPEGRRRQLLQAGGGGGGTTRAGGVFTTTFGYRLVAELEDPRALDLRGAANRARFVGGPDRNRVLGGMLIHQTRKGTDTSYCDEASETFAGRLPASKFTKLSSDCLQKGYLQAYNASDDLYGLWDEVRSDPLHPFGSDPIWIHSSKLFKFSMGGMESGYYNMSEGSYEVNPFSGAMYAHFQREVPGKEPGFPVYIDASLDEIRLAQLLVYVEDSNYLDERSQHLTVQMGVYNPELGIFGYGKGDVTRDLSGIWTQEFSFNALPALEYNTGTFRGRMSALGDNLAVVCAALYLVWYLYVVFSHPHMSVQLKRAKAHAMDLAIICGMVVALTIYYMMVSEVLEFSPREHYDVYDAVTYAPARFLLPDKIEPSGLSEGELAQLEAEVSAMNGTAEWASSAGLSGRWLLPTNETGIREYGDMMARLDRMADLAAFYGAVQGIVVVAMIFWMLHLWNFQDQVGIVTRTLFRVLPELGEFAIVLGILMVLYASYGVIVAGSHVKQYTSITEAFYSLFVIIVAGDGGEMHEFIRKEGVEYLTVEHWNIDFWYFSIWIFFFFTLTSYLLGFLGYALEMEKIVSDSGRSPWQDIRQYLAEHWKSIRRQAPSNREVVRRLEHLLDGIDNEIDVNGLLRRQLKLGDDDVLMQILHVNKLKLDRRDLEDIFLSAHNASRKKHIHAQNKNHELSRVTSFQTGFQNLKNRRPGEMRRILGAVENVIAAYAEEYMIDPRLAASILGEKQECLYKSVLEAILVLTDAVAKHNSEQKQALAELEQTSSEVCGLARALGDSSMHPFTASSSSFDSCSSEDSAMKKHSKGASIIVPNSTTS
uniref:Polycystin cation channel PKD1/PKD2 domain-containing protein n=1 Tax=Tetraselmis sp. GSL018 TaxID=582737 RepID=A0A061QSZ8_9CHLO